MQECREDRERRQPAKRDYLPASQSVFVLMGSLHSISVAGQLPKMSFILAASWKSSGLIPFTLCVFRSITTLFHTLNHSG